MKIECENCGGTDWVLSIYEMRAIRRTMVYSALKCKGCGINYPLQELGKNVKKETVISMLKQ